MEMNNKKNIILEEYENEFSYKKSKTNLDIQFNRIAFIFFVFLVISVIYSIQLLHLGSLKEENSKEFSTINKNHRADILDRNGNYLVKTVKSIDIGINPIEAIDKKKLLINLQLKISYYLLFLMSLNEVIVLNKLLKSLGKQKK